MILAAVIAIEVLTFPYQDVGAAVRSPSPASFLPVAADVAVSVVPFYPQARLAAVALNVGSVHGQPSSTQSNRRGADLAWARRKTRWRSRRPDLFARGARKK